MKANTTVNDFVLPAELKTAVDQYTNKNDPILLLTPEPYYYVALDRRHCFKWGIIMDQRIRSYDGTTEEGKLRLLKMELEKKLPKLMYLKESWLFPSQQKHLKQVFIPLIKEHHYKEIYKDIFLLPSSLK